MKYEFTKDELFEIEKQFDILAGINIKNTGEILSKIQQNECSNEFIKRLVESQVKSFDVYRIISAKCEMIRNDTTMSRMQ